MTTAEKIAGGAKPTAKIKEAAEAVLERARASYDGLQVSLDRRELRMRAHEEAIKSVLRAALDAGGEPPKKLVAAIEQDQIRLHNAEQFSGLTHAEADEIALAYFEDWQANGCYAYRFEEMDDGSILAVFVLGPDDAPQFVAFPDMGATSEWHPVRAPAE